MFQNIINRKLRNLILNYGKQLRLTKMNSRVKSKLAKKLATKLNLTEF